MNDSNARLQRPDFARPSTPARATLVFVVFLTGSALLGGLLGLFEMQSHAAAMARAAAPADAASSAIAVREPQAGSSPSSTRRLTTGSPA
jgi:hypothetical protein